MGINKGTGDEHQVLYMGVELKKEGGGKEMGEGRKGGRKEETEWGGKGEEKYIVYKLTFFQGKKKWLGTNTKSIVRGKCSLLLVS